MMSLSFNSYKITKEISTNYKLSKVTNYMIQIMKQVQLVKRGQKFSFFLYCHNSKMKKLSWTQILDREKTRNLG
jgi:hypothetical protein